MALLHATDIESFRTDGFVVLHDLLPVQTLEILQQGVEKNLSSPSHWANDYTPENSSGRFFDDYVSWQRISEFKETALRSTLATMCAGQVDHGKHPHHSNHKV